MDVESALSHPVARFVACTGMLAGGTALAAATVGVLPAVSAGAAIVTGLPLNVLSSDLHNWLVARLSHPSALLANQDLYHLTVDSIETVVRAAAKERAQLAKRSGPGVRPRLTREAASIDQLASAVRKHWQKFETAPTLAQSLAEISDEKTKTFFSADVDAIEAQTALDLTSWLTALRAIAAWGRVEVADDSLDYVAAKLHTTLPKAIFELLKEDFGKDGKAFASLHLQLMAEILRGLRTTAEENAARWQTVDLELETVVKLQERICRLGDHLAERLGELAVGRQELIETWRREAESFQRYFETTFREGLIEIRAALIAQAETAAKLGRRSETHRRDLRESLKILERIEAELTIEHPSALYHILLRAAAGEKFDVRFVEATWLELRYRTSATDGVVEYVHFDDRGDDGDVNLGRLRHWLSDGGDEASIAARMRANVATFMTILVRGQTPKNVVKFVPELLRTHLAGHDSRAVEQLPKTYRHLNDPQGGGDSAGVELRKRVRIVPLPNTNDLRLIGTILLQESFDVRTPHAARIALAELDFLLKRALPARSAVPWERFEQQLRSHRLSQGSWETGQSWLRKEIGTSAVALRGEPLRWSDFEEDRFAKRPQMGEAWETLHIDGGFLVLSGAVGTGKTTVFQYLAHRYLQSYEGGRVYYLSAAPTLRLDEELQFFERRLDSKSLFIVDDENFAPEEVERIYQTFLDYKTGGHVKASLAIGSKTTYGRTEGLEKGRRTGGLRQATHVRLPNDSTEEVRGLLSQLRRHDRLRSVLSDDELATLGGGVLSFSLLLADCTQSFQGRADFAGILKSRKFVAELERFVIESLGGEDDAAEFRDEIAPVFVLAAFRLPIPAEMNRHVPRLARAGFLEPLARGAEAGLYRAVDLKLAFIFQEQYAGRHLEILDGYLNRYPQWMPDACARLADWNESQNVLCELFERHREALFNYISDDAYGLTTGKAASMLRAIRTADRSGLAVSLLRQWAAPRRAANLDFFPAVVRRAANTAELTSFMNVLREIDFHDRILPMLVDQLSFDEEDRILLLFGDANCELDEIGACLRSLWRISSEFARGLFERFRESSEYRRKVERLDDDWDQLSKCVRYCDHLRALDVRQAYEFLETHLPREKIVDSVLVSADSLYPLSSFLVRLQRLHPRWASESLSLLWKNHRERLVALLRRESHLDTLSQELYAFSAVNGRIAVGFAYAIADRLTLLVQLAERYDTVGAAIENARRHLSPKLADRLARAIDAPRVLNTLKGEHGHVDKVGKFLFDLAQASPSIAAEFEERLEYRSILRVAKARRLRDVAILVRGFLMSAAEERRERLRKEMLSDGLTLKPLLRDCWTGANSATECAFGLTALLACPLGKDEILRLLGLANEKAIEESFARRIDRDASVLDVSNGLYALARFNVAMAKRALRRYADDVLGARRGPRDRGFHIDKNLVDNGNLLHIAASIDLVDARRLLRSIDVESLAAVCRAEADLGRLTVFLTGVAHASRDYALRIVAGMSSADDFERLCGGNEKLENLVHFARALASISREVGRRFVEHLAATRQVEIATYIGAQSNVAIVTAFVRTFARVGGAELADLLRNASATAIELLEEENGARPYLETCEAIFEAGHADTARRLASTMAASGPKIGASSSLRGWIVAVQKAIRLERELGMPHFCEQAASDLTRRQMDEMLRSETQVALAAFACFLFRRSETKSLGGLREAVLSSRAAIADAVHREPSGVVKIVATILLQADPPEVRSAMEVDSLDGVEAWEIGLASLLYEIAYGAESAADNPARLVPQSENWTHKIAEGLGRHAPNLEFALTHHLARQLSWRPKRDADYAEARQRALDESSSAIAWLLRREPTDPPPPNLDYYLWSLLQSAIFRPTYFPWEQELDKAARRSALGGRYLPDISTLATIGAMEVS